MRVHVINLAAATGRLAHMTRVLGEAGIAFERFDAIDPVRALAHPCLASLPPMAERGWTPAEIGCLLSHYEVWHLVAAGDAPFAAVLEDDLLVAPALASLLGGRLAIPRDADLVKLETTGVEVSLSRLARCRATGGIRFHRLRSLHHGTGAYLLSRRAAGVLIGRIAAFDAPVDDALFSPAHPVGGMLRSYQVVPALAVQSVILPDAGREPALESGMERVRNAARDINTAMARGGNLQRQPERIAGATPPRGSVSAAAGRRLDAVRGRLFERRMVVPFGLIPQQVSVHQSPIAEEGAGA